MVRFRPYLTYPKPPTETGLGWAHYRELTRLKDPAERAFYERLAVDGGLSRNALVRAIRDDTYVEKAAPTSTGRRAPRLKRPARVVVKMYESDRYVADVFYSTRKRPPEEVFARGRFLNQRLLDAGLATKA